MLSGAVCVAYLLAGRASLPLALPPAYAAPIWPPAGIALAAALLGGARVFPGLLLGSFLLEQSINREGSPPLTQCLASAAIAGGVLLQAQCALALIRRVSGAGNPLDRGGSVLPVILLGGPVACTINASVATLALWAVGNTSAGDVAFTWGSWWIGDSVGVVFFAPMLLACWAKPAALWRPRRASVVGPLAGTFVLLVGLYVDTSAREADRQQDEFEHRALAIGAELSHHLGVQIATLRGVEGLFGASVEVSAEEFSAFIRITGSFEPGLRLVAWAPVLAGGGGLRAPVTYVEPVTAALIGFDLASEPRRRAAIERARTLGVPSVSAPLRPAHDTAEVGVLVATPAADGRGGEGVVVADLDIRTFLESAVPRAARPGMALRLTDGETGDVLYEEAGPPGVDRWSGDLPAAGRVWRMDVWSTLPAGRSWFAWLVLAGGLLVAGLLVTVFVEIVTRAVKVEALVAARTAELERANAALARSNVDLQRFAYVASHDMREPLRVVTTYAELIAEELGPQVADEQRQRLQRVIENARRMQALVGNLLEHARALGSVEPFRPADLGALARAALENLALSVQESGAVVSLGPLPTVRCDPVEILSLFQNLLGNALKFRRPEVPLEISVQARRVDDAWEVSVRDNGIGIPPAHRERVFEMFQRLHPRDRYPGTGLGLAVCRRIVERHGGKISIETTDGPGTVVRFTLPDPG